MCMQTLPWAVTRGGPDSWGGPECFRLWGGCDPGWNLSSENDSEQLGRLVAWIRDLRITAGGPVFAHSSYSQTKGP